MIKTTNPSFFIVEAEAEGLEYIISALASSAGGDLTKAVLVSSDFAFDIQATAAMDQTIQLLTQQLPAERLEEEVTYNPLYLPSEISTLDEVLEEAPAEQSFKFVGLSGNPYVVKRSAISTPSHSVIKAQVQYRPFDLPSYTELQLNRTGHQLQ